MDTNIETKEEMIEDINEVESAKEESLDDTVVLEDISKIDDSEFKEEVSSDSEEITDEAVEEYIKKDKKKKKTLLIVILSILLVLDIAALVIYLIGIDKVLGFIK